MSWGQPAAPRSAGCRPAGPSLLVLLAVLLLVACDPAPSGHSTSGRASDPEAPTSSVGAVASTVASSAATGLSDAEQRDVRADAGRASTALARPADDGWIEAQLRRYPERFGRWLDAAAAHRLQILVAVVRGQGEARRLERHGYRVDAEYVYPASAIKPLLAVTSLIELGRLAAQHGVELDASTPLAPCLAADGDCRALGDPSNLRGGTLCVGHEIRKLLLVSDNDAFARLYDLVGQWELNQISWELGLSSVRFHHRMGESSEAGRRSRGLDLLLPDGARIHVPARENERPLPSTAASRLEVGRAYLDAQGRLHDQPMSFARKNYASLSDLQSLLIALVLPDLPGAPRLGLAAADRELLLEALTQAPTESDNPRYQAAEHPVEAHKPLLPGLRAVLAPQRIRHLGKAGHAYGFQVVNAYVEDRPSGRALFVAAAIHVNPNQVLNDDRYDYDGSTRPFMRDLGEAMARAVLLEPPAR